VLRPSHPPWSTHLNNIRWIVRFVKLLNTYFYISLSYVGPNILVSTRFSKFVSVFSSIRTRRLCAVFLLSLSQGNVWNVKSIIICCQYREHLAMRLNRLSTSRSSCEFKLPVARRWPLLQILLVNLTQTPRRLYCSHGPHYNAVSQQCSTPPPPGLDKRPVQITQ
jgi:hypothetical protein